MPNFLLSGLCQCRSGASYPPDGLELLSTCGVVLAQHTWTGRRLRSRHMPHPLARRTRSKLLQGSRYRCIIDRFASILLKNSANDQTSVFGVVLHPLPA